MSFVRKSADKLKLVVLAAWVGATMLALPATALADEAVKQASDEASKQMEAAAGDIANLVKRAVTEGDAQAISFLIKNYIAPALMILAGLYLAWTIASIIGRFVGKKVEQKVDVTLGRFLTKAVRNLIMLVVALGVLQSAGIGLTSVTAILAAAGFAVGMALQGTLGHFASGVMLLMFRPFKVNDYIVVADTEGTVEEIDLFTTRINTLDNRHIIIPNGEIFGSKLENYTRNELRRVDVNVGACYNADLDRTRAALERAVAASSPEGTPRGQVYLMELGGSSVDWQLRAWCEPADFWGVREKLTASAKIELDRAGISIPYPQMDVHVGGKLLAKAA